LKYRGFRFAPRVGSEGRSGSGLCAGRFRPPKVRIDQGSGPPSAGKKTQSPKSIGNPCRRAVCCCRAARGQTLDEWQKAVARPRRKGRSTNSSVCPNLSKSRSGNFRRAKGSPSRF
jgi:hypothetical protein